MREHGKRVPSRKVDRFVREIKKHALHRITVRSSAMDLTEFRHFLPTLRISMEDFSNAA